MLVADVDGQFLAEVPDAYELVRPVPLGANAGQEERQARTNALEETLETAKAHEVVVCACDTTNDFHALRALLLSDRLGPIATLGLDSLTFLLDRMIAEICGVTIIHKQNRDSNEETTDPVLTAIPDFSGAGVKRAMERKDWQRFAQKSSELVSGTLALCRRLNIHCVMTALEVKRELWDEKGRFLGLQQGPLLRGRVSANDIPPLFQFFLHLQSRVDDQDQLKFGAWTVPKDGWPAGVRGTALQKLPPCIPNPHLHELLKKAGQL